MQIACHNAKFGHWYFGTVKHPKSDFKLEKKKWTLTIWESQTPNVQFQNLKIDSLNISQIKKVEHPFKSEQHTISNY